MRLRSQRSSLIRILCACIGLSYPLARNRPALAQAASSSSIKFVVGSGDCPNAAAVEQAVLSLIPPERHELLQHGVRVELEDLGDSYRVIVAKDGHAVQKRYADPARDCEGRTRFAAVFSVLTLMPPDLGLDPRPEIVEPVAPPEPPEPKAAPPPPAPAPVKGPVARVELSALYVDAPAILHAPGLDSFGGELRLALGRGAVSGTLSVAYTTRAKFALAGVRGDLAHLPVSAGVRVQSELGAWTLAAELGLLLTAESVRATNLASAQSRHFLDIGLRTGLAISPAGNARLVPFLALFAWVSPAPREIIALPRGQLGNLPYLWIGGAVGVSLGL